MAYHDRGKQGTDGKRRGENSDRQKNRKGKSKSSGSELKKVVLPYQFIPFGKDEEGNGPKYYFPYQKNVGDEPGHLPRHDSPTGLSGTIEYEIQPHSSLVLELRKKWHNGALSEDVHFLSGSQTRGKVRANAEMISHSFPEFVNKNDFSFRDFANPGAREAYRKGLNMAEGLDGKGETRIEKTVKVGFLTKVGERYYVMPAERFESGEYFKTIKEHEMLSRNSHMPRRCQIFDWKPGQIELLQDRDRAIEELTEQLKRYGVDRQAFTDLFMGEFSYIKLSKRLPGEDFNKDSQENLEVEGKVYPKLLRNSQLYSFLHDERGRLLEALKGKQEPAATEQFLELYSARWMLKIERALFYKEMGGLPKQFEDCQHQKNTKYQPYQYHNKKENLYYYNSSIASTKNKHYIIKPPTQNEILEVPDQLKHQYIELLKTRMKFPSAGKDKNLEEEYKEFYDLFKCSIDSEEGGEQVVFYLTEGTRIVAIGRTPYLRVPVSHPIRSLLGEDQKRQGKVDYARAIFGFVSDEERAASSLTAYKSRVRFGPVTIGRITKREKPKNFLLQAPSATAAGMYLKQKVTTRKQKQRYSNAEQRKPQLRGHKYYLIRKREQRRTEATGNQQEEIHSTRTVYDIERMTGKIYFSRLSIDELGLLLLSVDVGQLELVASQNKEFPVSTETTDFNRLYEQIGGAKPYGYGKVQMKVAKVRLEAQDVSFETLLDLGQSSRDENKQGDSDKLLRIEAILAFIRKMEGEYSRNYLNSETFQQYLLSKKEYAGTIREWTDMTAAGKGYKDSWILGPRTPE